MIAPLASGSSISRTPFSYYLQQETKRTLMLYDARNNANERYARWNKCFSNGICERMSLRRARRIPVESRGCTRSEAYSRYINATCASRYREMSKHDVNYGYLFNYLLIKRVAPPIRHDADSLPRMPVTSKSSRAAPTTSSRYDVNQFND